MISGRYRAMLRGMSGNYGIIGNVESVTYRQGRAAVGSNPTLSAILRRRLRMAGHANLVCLHPLEHE